MRLVFCLVCIGLTSSTAQVVEFDEPRDPVTPWEIPRIFPTRIGSLESSSNPLAVEAVLSVALKLQAIEDHEGRHENFLVSPLAVAGALGQLMLGARGELRKQIGILLTLRDAVAPDIANKSTTPVQPHDTVQSATTVQERLSNPVTQSPATARSIVAPRFGTISAQDAGAYEVQRAEMPNLPVRSQDGLPGLLLHRQLGNLIRTLSRPLPVNGTSHSITDSSYLHTSSAFFMDRNLRLNTPFARAVVDFYGSKLEPLDFRSDPVGAQNKVNDWGSRETGGLIKQFLPYPPPLDTAVIQAVAVHFRGAWLTPFVPEGTIPGKFQTSANTQVPVKYMRGSFEEAYYAENMTLGLRLLVLPYSNYDCAMYVILPTDDNELKYNVGHLVTQLSSRKLAELVGTVKSRTVNVMFPKLSLTGSLRLASALEKHAAFLTKQKTQQRNGFSNITARVSEATTTSTQQPIPTTPKAPILQSTVDPLRVIPLDAPQPGPSSEATQVPEGGIAQNAQITSRVKPDAPELGVDGVSQKAPENPTLILTGAAENSTFRVSEIIQQIALEVNEAGTEAAAIAGSTVNYSGDVKNFKVNRPFLFFIRHEGTGALLFWGTIVDPTA